MSRKKLVLDLSAEEKKNLTATIRAETSDKMADTLDVSRATVNLRRQKFLTKRMEEFLKDEQRPCRPHFLICLEVG